MTNEWISIKDKFPDTETDNCSIDVLLKNDKYEFRGYVYLNDLHDEDYPQGFDLDARQNAPITHWKYLPPIECEGG